MSRTIYVVIGFLICSFLTIACDREGSHGNLLVIGQASETERLNPITIKSPQSFRVAWQIYEGLLDLDPKGNILPRLAEKWESKDNKVWIFHIRKGVNFHKSDIFGATKVRSVTAHDVYYSYKRFCASDSYPAFLLTDSIVGASEFNAGKSTDVAGLKVIDDYTFQITLKNPEPFFLSRITSPWLAIFPKECEYEQNKGQWGLSLVIGTGPYVLHSNNGNEITLSRNTDYWDKNRVPKIEEIKFKVIKNDQLRFSEMKNGALDFLVLPTALFPVAFDKKGTLNGELASDFSVNMTSTFNTHQLAINMTRVSDVHLRRAMFFGTNRKELVQNILFGHADPIAGPIPPGMRGYKSLLDPTYDPQRAKMELEQSDYDGKPVELLVHELANSELIGQVFQQQMRDIGVNIKLSKVDFNSAMGRMIKGDADMVSMFAEIVFSSPEPLLISLFSSTKIPVPNFWRYTNPEIDKQLQTLGSIRDKILSLQSSAQIEKTVMDDVPAIFLYRQKQVVMLSNKFRNLQVNGNNHFFLETLEPVPQ